jgi:cobalt-zinc-cadmium efflux system membrane fusion protein
VKTAKACALKTRAPINQLLALSIGLLAGAAALLTGCNAKKESAPAAEVKGTETTITIPTNSPALGSIKVEDTVTSPHTAFTLGGRLIWDEDSTVRVFTPFAGIVRTLHVEVNQPVQKGSILAEIQSPDFGQAMADARKAASDFRRADQALSRARDLFDHGAAPRKDVENAEADFASAKAERDRSAGRLAIYGATIEESKQGFLLPSPLSGVLVEKSVNPGQEVRPDQMLANIPQVTAPLFVVTDPSRLWIQIDATEMDLPHLKPGQSFTLTSRAFEGRTFTGKVDVVSEFIDPTTRTIKVRGTVDNSERMLKAEMFVNVNLPGDGAGNVSVPSKAVFLNGEKHYVFVEDEPGQFARQEIQVGTEQDGHVLVRSGLHSGQRVVTDGCILLQQSLK